MPIPYQSLGSCRVFNIGESDDIEQGGVDKPWDRASGTELAGMQNTLVEGRPS
jgi:hypothetical protein